MTHLDPSDFTIFLADDNPDNLEVLGTLLENEGYRVRAARDGQKALESIRLDPPDIVLLDVHMPHKDGYDACMELKADGNLTEIPVIFISALDETYNRLRGFEVGGSDYISKPFNAPEVLARVRTHLILKNRTDELKRSLNTLSQYQDSLIRNETQANLGYLVASLAHELGTPLGNIVLTQSRSSELIEEIRKTDACTDIDLMDQLEANFRHSRDALDNMRRLLKQFRLLGLDFVDHESSAIEIDEILGNLASFFPDRPELIEASIQTDADSGAFWTFGTQALLQMMINLVRNSLDHSGRACDELVITVSARRDHDLFILEYHDNGNGIDESLLPRIFDPFVSTRRSDSFLGLGLHLVFLIVTKTCNGTIEYDDSGAGAGFIIRIPMDSQ